MNTLASAQIRARDLLARMTTDDKIGQLNQIFCGWNAWHMEEGRVVLEPAFAEALARGGMGAVYGLHRTYVQEGDRRRSPTPEEGARAVAEIQTLARRGSRLGIPLLISEEAPKGYLASGATTLPSPLAYSSSWNPTLVREMGRMVAREIRAGGGHTGYSPVLDICQDPRWSRLEECYGEDPYLTGELGAAMVEGLQGDLGPESVISTLKHFVAYGTTEGGRNTSPAHMGPRELREIHLPPFERAVRAGALSVMCSYNDIDGIPVASDHHLLTNILRGTWGFLGFVVSDALAIDELALGNSENRKHRVAEDLAEAGALALRAGVDISLWDRAYLHLGQALDRGLITEQDLDRAVLRLLTLKIRLGLFEDGGYRPGLAATVVGAEAHHALSLEASRQSLVLLKNDDGLLPLRPGLKIAVIGPNSDNLANQLGTYAPSAAEIPDGVTVLAGLRQRFAGISEIRHAPGCRIKARSTLGFAEALEAAAWADVVVAVCGGSSNQADGVTINAAGQADPLSAQGDSDIDCGEGIDRDSLDLSGVQADLLTKLQATGKPMVLVLIQARPHTLHQLWDGAQAALCAWYPGPYGGQAISEALAGDLNPSGKLTLSFPKSTGQIPVHYNHKATAEKRYLGLDSRPQFPFGHGLSYTTFSYSDLDVSPTTIGRNGTVKVAVTVQNTGRRSGTEVVQVYLTDEHASVTRPVRSLRAFERVTLAPGESRRCVFALGRGDMAMWDRHLRLVVEPGRFTVRVGGDSQAGLSSEFRVI